MQKKVLFAIFAIAMMAMMLVPNVFAWSYGDPSKTDDLIFEKFGPRADNLLIQMYASQTSELEAGLEVDDIDVTDWPLDGTRYDRYTTSPWDDVVSVLGYGPEFGIYLFDLNNNNNLFLGNPQNPAYANPVYPNPMSDVDLRKAVGYLSDRAAYINYIGPTTVTALYTPVGPSA
ncbi:hypothetical protein MUP01_06695, partial [Candidatus Bathyarchaeota archaeon]|nr:hypothetical protein [Candidatus Bathyarchaeota archaeon]